MIRHDQGIRELPSHSMQASATLAPELPSIQVIKVSSMQNVNGTASGGHAKLCEPELSICSATLT